MPHLTLQFRRGTSTQWTNTNPVLAVAEMGIETNTHQFKIGDGVTAWVDLPYGGLQGPSVNIQNAGNGDLLISDGTSSHISATSNITFSSNNLTITGNIVLNGSVSIFKSSIYRTSANDEWAALTPWVLNPTTDMIIFNTQAMSSGEYWANIGAGADGQNLKLVYFNGENSNVCNVSANFGAGSLGTGSGLLSTIKFVNSGESAQLVYIADEGIWQIVNTGALVL